MANADDPTICTCSNVCNRAQVSGGKLVRNSCPCLSQGNFCSSRCSCGNRNMKCTNRLGRGGELEVQILAENDDNEQFQEEEDQDEGLMIAFDEDPPFVVPGTAGELGKSLQAEAEEHLDSSFAESEVDRNVSASVTFPTSNDVQDSSFTEGDGDPQGIDSATQLSNGLTKDTICAMPQRQLANILCTMLRLYPELIAAAMEPEPPIPPPDQVPGFCKCDRCQLMPTTKEQLCCRRGLRRSTCMTIIDAGIINQTILSLPVLQQAVHDHNDLNVMDDDPNSNDTLRHMAYRKFIIWRFGYLGPGDRRVIPSCMVWKIRRKYPSADGTYTGYKPSRR